MGACPERGECRRRDQTGHEASHGSGAAVRVAHGGVMGESRVWHTAA